MKHDRGRAIHRVRERESRGTGLDFDVLSGRHRKRISSRYMPHARVCPYPLCDSVIDVTFLVHRCVSVCTEIHARVRESRAERRRDRRVVSVPRNKISVHTARG